MKTEGKVEQEKGLLERQRKGRNWKGEIEEGGERKGQNGQKGKRKGGLS